MSETPSLFEEADWLNPSSNGFPLIWIKEVRLLRRLESGGDAEIRRIPLQRGLNIVWAKPANPDEPNASKRGSGHDVGKTTFCRLIRFLLGEEPCGSDDFRAGLAADVTLERAWVVGEVMVGDTLWSVARALYTGAHHFTVKDASLDEAIVLPASDRSTMETFLEAIEATVISPLPVQTFDDAGLRPIRWLHILEWVARDQEAHLSNLFKWRDPSSDHRSPDLSANEAQFLARCVLGVTDVNERKQIEIRAGLSRKKAEETENTRYHERRINDALTRVQNELPGGSDLPAVGEALFVDMVVKHAESLVRTKKESLESHLAELDVSDAEAKLEKAIGDTALAKSRYDELTQLLKELEEALARYSEKPAPTSSDEDEIEKALAKLRPDRAYCEIPIRIGLFRCPMLQDSRLSETESVGDSSKAVTAMAEEKREYYSQQVEGLRTNVAQAQAYLTECEERELNARTRRDDLRRDAKSLSDQISGLGSETAAWRIRAEDAQRSHTALEGARKALETIESDTEASKLKQDEAQKEARRRQGEIAAAFIAICTYFKGEQATADLKFTRDEIAARIGSGGGAYSALSSIAFDFAALLVRLHSIGHHPGLLIHDSPRESDMEPSLYYPLFKLIHQLAERAPGSFQYIVTTTEKPPAELCVVPHLCLELDGATSEGKLFKTTL